MRVRLKSIIAGPGINGQPGDVREVSDVMGEALVKGGYAERLSPPAGPVPPRTAPEPAQTPDETAVSKAAEERETAVARPRRRRSGEGRSAGARRSDGHQ